MSRKMLYIEWVDSLGQSHWQFKSDIEERSVTKVITVGIVVHEDKEQLVIAHSQSLDTDEWNSAIHIPKCCITKKRILKL